METMNLIERINRLLSGDENETMKQLEAETGIFLHDAKPLDWRAEAKKRWPDDAYLFDSRIGESRSEDVYRTLAFAEALWERAGV